MAEKKDKTFGFKATEDDYQKFESAFQASGFASKDEWMSSLVSKELLDSIKEANQEFKQDLSELEVHTSRINELVLNMINRAVYLRDDAVRGLQTQIESKDAIILGLQSDINGLKKDVAVSNEVTEKLTATNKELNESIADIKEELNERIIRAKRDDETKQSLIDELKEKNENLSSLVAEYKKFKDENESIKKEFGVREEKLLSSNQELKQSILDQQDQIERLQNEMKLSGRDHEAEIKRITSETETTVQRLTTEHISLLNQKEIDKQQALIDLEKKYQEEIAKLRETHNNKITELYERLDRQREINEKKK